MKFEAKLNGLVGEMRELQSLQYTTARALEEKEQLAEGLAKDLEQKLAENTDLQQRLVDQNTRTKS